MREIAAVWRDFEPPPMRCQISKVGGATIIDDTYNASPVAMRAALELLRDFNAPGGGSSSAATCASWATRPRSCIAIWATRW